jgi:hypothetical protein
MAKGGADRALVGKSWTRVTLEDMVLKDWLEHVPSGTSGTYRKPCILAQLY